MVLRWLIQRSRPDELDNDSLAQSFEELPHITVQIPIFNERFVAERAIESAVALDYPAEKLEIQIVDDSTDDTAQLVADFVAAWRNKGINILHIHRVNRLGFKAGALKDAMEVCSGEFIAIFDADFVPDTDFLLKTIHSFTEPKLAMVQTRWDHLNIKSNHLTSTQALMLDAHFSLEQNMRCQSGQLFNFNGTAGLWRKTAIIDAGNWSADTLTEDLDLSYRAQLAGWKLLYLNDVTCPAELPSNLDAFKSQQHRWAKGGTQVMLKMLGRVWRSSLPLSTKVESSFHLANNLAYLVMLVDSLLLLVPSLVAREHLGYESMFIWDIVFITLSSFSHLVYLFFGQVALGKSKWRALLKVPSLLLLGIHLALNNARAGFEALCGKQSAFVRTPKSGETANTTKLSTPANTQRYKAILPNVKRIELLIVASYVGVAVWAAWKENYYMLPFLILLIVGFSGVFFNSWRFLFEGKKPEGKELEGSKLEGRGDAA